MEHELETARSRSIWLVVCFMVLWGAAAFLFWNTTSGLVADSVTYLDAARSLAAGQGYQHRWAYWDPIYTDGQLPTRSSMWPAGFSLAIAGGMAAGIDGLVAGRLIVWLSFLLCVVLAFAWGRTMLAMAPSMIVATVAFVPSPEATMIASELPFLCAMSASMVFCVYAMRQHDSTRMAAWLTGASLCAGLSFFLRYVGLAAIAAVGAIAGFAWLTRRLRFGQLVATQLAGAAIAGAVLGRNWLVSGRLGQPWAGADIFWATLPDAVKSTVASFLRADVLQGPLRLLVLAKVVVLGALALIAFNQLRLALTRKRPPAPELAPTVILALFVLATAGLTVAATASNGMNLEPRYLTVFAPWGVAALAAWALSAAGACRLRRVARYSCAAWLFLEALVLIPAMNARLANYVDKGGANPAIAWIRAATPTHEVVLSNRGADVAYWLPNPVARIPRLPHSGQHVVTVEELDRVADHLGARYLVHFRGYPDDAKYDRAEFDFVRGFDDTSLYGKRVVATFADTVVYRVGTRWDGTDSTRLNAH